MRFDELRLRGISAAFPGEVHVDLRSLPGMLCAVTGPNGGGKSTMLGCLVAAGTRKMPDGQALAALATSRDSMVEATITNGQSFVLRQTIDAHTGKGEALVLHAETRRPIIDSAKRKEVDAWVRDHLPPPEVLYASVFGAQGSNGFLDLDPAPRKACIMQVLGHERLGHLAADAAEKGRAARAALDTCIARLEDERGRAGDPAAIDQELAGAVDRRFWCEEGLKTAEAVAGDARGKQAERREQLAARQIAEARRNDLVSRVLGIDGELDGIAEKVKNNASLIARGDGVRRAAAEVSRKDGEWTVAEKRRLEVMAANAEAEVAQAKARHAYDARTREAEAAARAVLKLRERVESLTASSALAAQELASVQMNLGAETAECDRMEQELTEARSLRLDGKDRRIGGLRGALEGVATLPERISGLRDHARWALEDDDALAEELEALPARIDELEAGLDQHRTTAQKLMRRVAALKAEAAGLGQLEALTKERDEAEAAAKAAGAALMIASGAFDIADAALVAAAEKVAPAAHACEAVRVTDEERKLANLLPTLEAAEARIAELGERRADLEAKRADLEAEREAITLPVVGPDVDMAAAERAVSGARADLTNSEVAVQRLEDALKRARASAERVEQLAAERRRLEEDLADWRLLEQGLGRNGVQALELDAAGPELTELANDLLHHCLGSRFSVRFESAVEKKSGKGDKEGCWVFVYDAEANREGEAKTFSGGEKALIAEAVNLAIAMLGIRHAGMDEVTLIRDETGAALDGNRGVAYIQMLRRAAKMVNARQVLFVSHDERLWELADCRLIVSDGRVEVCS